MTPSPSSSIHFPQDIVTLSAIEFPGFRFTGWGDALSGLESPAALTMDGRETVSAEFKRIWSLEVLPGINGDVSITPEEAEYLEGDVVTLTAVPDTGYELGSWSGDASGNTSPLTFTVSSDISISASFIDTTPPSVTIVSPAAGSTNNQLTALFGTVSDNDAVASVRWERNGTPIGQLDATGGLFSVTDLVLNPGVNTFTVFALDPEGNESPQESVIDWLPDRTISIESPPEARD